MNFTLQHKDKRLKEIVFQLMNKFDTQIKVMDFWESDLSAIGICDKSERQLVYISIFGLSHGKCNIVLEQLNENRECQDTIGMFNNISLPELEQIMIDHLKIVRK